MKFFLSYLFLVFWATFINAQNIFYDQLNTESGLPSSTVFDIFQDSKRFIWLATEEGLIKYNGVDFKTYSHSDLHSKSGSNIKEDVLGRVWYQTFDGYLYYVNSKDELETFSQTNNIGFVNFVITNQYLIKAHWQGIEIRDLYSLKKIKNIKIKKFQTSFLDVLDDEIILGNETTQTISLKKWKTKIIENKEIKRSIKVLSYKRGNQIYFFTQDKYFKCKLLSFDKEKFTHLATFSIDKQVQNFEIINQEVWLCTKEGVRVFSMNGKELSFTKNLPKEDISKVFKDKNNVFWFSSLKNGVYIIKNFQTLELQIPSEKFTSITDDGERIYVGGSSGKIYTLNEKLQYQNYWQSKDAYPVYYLNFNADVDYNFFSANGFYIQHKKSKRIVHYNSAVKHLFPFSENRFLVSGTGFVNTISTRPKLTWENNLLTNIRGKSIVYDALHDRVLVASNNGLLELKENKVSSLFSNGKILHIKNLIIENDRIIALSNHGELFEIKGLAIKKIKTNRLFNLMLKDENQVLLIDKNTVFKLQSYQFNKLFSLGKFLRIKGINYFKGSYYAITEDKIIKINNRKTSFTSFQTPQIIIENIAVNGMLVSLEKKLKYSENDVQINFNVLNFDFDDDYQIVYKVNGVLKNLNNNSKNIKLVALAPGEYSIQLGLMNKNTSEIKFTIKPITFEILPPLWKRAWFITLIICSFLLMSFLLYRWKIIQLKRKNAEKIAQITLEKNLKESKLQLIKSQMNPHFFFNAINNIQSYIFTNDTQVASAYLSKFSKLTRKILELSDTDTVTLQDEIDTLKLYLELQKMRFEDFNFKIYYEQDILLNDVRIPTMLFQPYVENAILHGLAHSNGEKNLSIEFRVDRTRQLITTIKDNGIGRVKSEELNKLNTSKPKSFATKANLDRIMLLNKDQYNITIDYTDLYDENEESNGTLVTIKMKI
ncbi:histidine kinase [Chryseobacterium suipulveris]|uniref:Histidine kinase n=1 Tax=Chryseobacterium suipulveris TaxID=2929800 RepID=A0ABY4BNF5_9FLAO|nr:histidine kinase [Chryseobacterium suipulveris]UOE40716.1 histidine kinase [Chryseobacterium suipulveris]